MTIGNKIRRARKYANMTQRELGIAVGFSPQTADARMTQYETGKRNPKAPVLEAIAEALHIPLQYFYLPTTSSEPTNTPSFLFSLEQSTPFTLSPASAVGGTSDTDIFLHFEDPKDQEFLRQWMYMRRNLQNGYISEDGYFGWQMSVLSGSERGEE